MFVLVTWMLGWVLGGRHVPDPSSELSQFFFHLGFALVNACLLWLVYVALEPYVRRYCPDIMISWTRVLGGQIRDARVGRDVLIGVSAGILVLLVSFSVPLLAALVGRPLPPRGFSLQYLLGARFALAAQLRAVPNALQNAMLVALVFVVGRAISGRRWVGAVTAVVLFGVLVLGEFGDSVLIGILFALLFTGALVSTLVYFGLLAHVVAFFVNLMLVGGVLTVDMSKVYAPTSAWLMFVIVGLAAFGFYASRAGQPTFGNLLPRD
jgi:hypothetical protein